jgi:hypothetical protein
MLRHQESVMAGTPGSRARRDRFASWAADASTALSELCDWIETRGADGHLLAFSRQKDFAYTTVRDWIAADSARSAGYATARERRADVIAEELIAIADAEPLRTPQGAIDPAGIAHQRLRVETRRWAASKLAPRRYGDKVEVDARLTGNPMAELVERIHRTGSRLPMSGPK